MGGVEADGVHLGVDQRGDAIHHIAGDANGGGAEQATLTVLGGVGVLLGLLDVLDGDEAAQHVVLVHQRQFFDAVFGEDLARLFQRGAHRGGDEVFRGHDLGDLAGIVGLKAQIAVGEDADQLAVFGDGHAGDAVARHQFLRVGDEMIRGEEERIGDDAVFRTLDLVHLRGLRLDGHVLVDDAQTAFAGDGDGQTRVGDGIHGGAHQGDVQGDALGERHGGVYLLGQHIALAGDQQNVVKSKPFPDDRHSKASISDGISTSIAPAKKVSSAER